MKKIMLTLVLAIAAGVWNWGEAACYTQEPEALYLPNITVSGTIQWLDAPCEEGEVCPPCMTPAIVTSNETYYISTSNQEVQEFLDWIETSPVPAIYLLPLQAKASGTPYQKGNYKFLVVSSIDGLSVQYFSDQLGEINSICDEWNIAKISGSTSPHEEIHTVKVFLGADTIIETLRYAKLFEAGIYKGALREGVYRSIYYIPAGSTHEYLLYKFNASVGDRLSNLWTGGNVGWCPNGYNTTVVSISEGTPRVFTIEVEYVISDSEGDHIEPRLKYWTEGVGMSEGPVGMPCDAPYCACSCGQVVLCAYKNGEQIYTSPMGEQYGCVREDFIEGEFVTLYGNRVESFRECSIDGCPTCFGSFMTQDASIYSLTATDTLIMEQLYMLPLGKQVTIKGVWTKCKNIPFIEVNAIYETKDTIPSDTIPLYIKDGPGTSTVDPADPNLIYAVLRGDMLIIRDFTGAEIFLTLSRNGSLFSPHRARHAQAQSFTNTTSVELTEEGTYDIELTSESWNYIVIGSFDFNKTHEAVEIITSEHPAASKILRNGQLLIRIGDQLYTPSGVLVQ